MADFWVKKAISILRQNGSREPADAVAALAARLAKAERLLQWVDDQGRLDARDAFDFREMHAKYKTRATDSADEVQT